MRKENFFFYYILISLSILYIAFKNNDSIINRILILGIIVFFGMAIWDHFYEIKELIQVKSKIRKVNFENILLILGTTFAASITWHINHTLGYGHIIANGIVGIFVGLLFSKQKAGAFYIASFVGMSGEKIVSSMFMAGLIGLFAGFVIIFSKEVYDGIGGKGGTIAALSTQIVRLLMGLFI
ncbi:hypothetical protein [Tepidimicrobium xylanilyticum]|uniref:Uncharacterized protein n=1 Tax=Tepidimicrobium xylanilyticum TaxID=1123352 RepID=A0A1H3B6J7_9FIRM|nr:hypothetical protein [Tepidimicrobium xylanilyticum]GMG96983.1 hypothetical protein EN5CB1_18090 [Tepidimicrobium xylanilyticum]SDX37572.1 hypothetical protein SAMN05660923_02189 [Tepidimicrobium xylanilyticum]